MNWSNSLQRVLVGAVASLTALGAYGAQKGSGGCGCSEEPKPGPFAFSYPKDLNITCPADFYAYGTFTMLQAKEDGLNLGICDADGYTLPLDHGEVIGFSHEDSDWDFNPGFRIGIGVFLQHDAWSLDFDWMWLRFANYHHYTASTGAILPIWMPPQSPTATCTHLTSAWNGHYNTLDGRIGKPYHISRYLVVKPHVGIRAGWIDQHFGVHYFGTFGGPQVNPVHTGNNDFWGVGARFGLDSEWMFGQGWQLFGNVAGSLLFGKFDVDQHIVLGAGAANQGFNLDFDQYQNVPNIDMELGIAWNKYFDNNRYRLGFAVAYEFHEWFDQFNMMRFFGRTTAVGDYQWQPDNVARGNFTLNGFSFKIQLDI